MVDRIIEILRSCPHSTRDLSIALRSTPDRVRPVLHALEARRVVCVRGREHGSYLWYLLAEPAHPVAVAAHRILRHVVGPTQTTRVIVARSGMSDGTARKHLRRAEADGLVVCGPLGWSLTAAGREHVRARLGEAPAVAVSA